MATQIAPTPTLRGNDARRVWEEVQNYKPSENVQKGAELLAKFFEKMRE